MIQIFKTVAASQFGHMRQQMMVFVNSVTGLFCTKLNTLEVSYSKSALSFNNFVSH